MPIIILALIGCPTVEDSGEPSTQYAGPDLSHVPPGSAANGQAISLRVTARDNDGIAGVQAYYRVIGGPIWAPITMEGDGDVFSGAIPGDSVVAPGVEYYFEASDLGDPSASSKLPESGEREPYTLSVSVVGERFPFTEDFEPESEETTSLSSFGWANASQGFTGYSWELSTRFVHGGGYSVAHGRGADGIDTIVDWLITPAIDLSRATNAEVRWYELGVTPDAANHGLYLSTGSRDPADGDYVAIKAALPSPNSEEWARSAGYDLSAYVGQVVYLAWRFEGADSDDWYIDDVSVAGLAADLTAETTVVPAELQPGDTAVLSVTVTNPTTVDAANVRVSADFTASGARITTPAFQVGTIAAGSSTTVDFSLVVDSNTAANRYVPLSVLVESNSDTFTLDAPLLVGVPSVASLTWEAETAGSLLIEVGVGDPDAPDWSTTAYSGAAAAGSTTFTADITDGFASLPPSAGDNRWWARIDTAVAGSVVDFALSYGGNDYVSIATPLVVESDDLAFAYVPTPAEPFLVRSSTSPATLEPGSSGINIDFTVLNRGEVSSGPIYATLVSSHADLTVLDAGPILLDPDLFEAAEQVSADNAFSFAVAASHTDSTDVTASLVLDDGAESWVLPLSFDVPFPVLEITRVEIDDDGRDGILNPDEEADLTFRVANRGGKAASGIVSASLTATTTGSATLNVDDNVESLGSMSVGSVDLVGDFEVEVVGGALGDEVDLLLTLTDSLRTYQSHYSVILGDTPWQDIADLNDRTGDPVREGEPDILNGSFRVVGDLLQVRITFDGTPDLDTLFITSWASATSGSYDLYELGAQSGIGSLRGYSFSTSSFYELAAPAVSYPDANTVQLDLSLTALGLTFDEFTMGFGAGWCGEPDYYCDHFPDYWGYPYDSYNPTDWYTLNW